MQASTDANSANGDSGGGGREPLLEETPAAFDKEHYARGLNANFLLGSKEDIIVTHAGEKGSGGGRFENPETRDIAQARMDLMHAIEAIVPLEGKIVADIGAGTGLFLDVLHRAVGPTGGVVAVELSSAFCEHLKERAATLPKDGASVSVVHCTDRQTNLAPNSTDLAMIVDVYHHFEYPKTFMRSLWEAMKPGGTVVIVDFIRDDNVHKSHPPGWILAHVRGDQATFRAEVEEAGFTYVKDASVPRLTENYVMVFRK
eukprot:m.170960 g.170960  ORF g.170960 m.170960 type:complete len:258 (-) comp13313_c0_seq1:78-851(-)